MSVKFWELHFLSPMSREHWRTKRDELWETGNKAKTQWLELIEKCLVIWNIFLTWIYTKTVLKWMLQMRKLRCSALMKWILVPRVWIRKLHLIKLGAQFAWITILISPGTLSPLLCEIISFWLDLKNFVKTVFATFYTSTNIWDGKGKVLLKSIF